MVVTTKALLGIAVSLVAALAVMAPFTPPPARAMDNKMVDHKTIDQKAIDHQPIGYERGNIGDTLPVATMLVGDKECVYNGDVIGQCGSHTLLNACDGNFDSACIALGGTVNTSPLGDTYHCNDNHLLLPACTSTWKQACRTLGGEFACENDDCTEGSCEI